MTKMDTEPFAGFGAGKRSWLVEYAPWFVFGFTVLPVIVYIGLIWGTDISNLKAAYVFNIGAGLACLGCLSVLSLAFALERTPVDTSRLLFLALIVITLFGLVTDNMSWLMDGRPKWRVWNVVFSFVSFLVFPIISPVFWGYQNSLLPRSSQMSRHSKMVIAAFTVLNFVYICAAGMMGFLFTVDEAGVYHSGAGYTFAILYPIIMMVVTIIQNVRQKMELRKRLSLLSFCLMPGVAGCFQVMSDDYSFGYVVGFCELILIYGVVQMERSISMANQQREIAEKNRELAEQQMQIMVSQIQPHFMYNALGTISALCTEEPELAQEATDTFADYLRANLNAMGQRQPVSFENELKHVKSYVWIEELRFQDYLHVEYDIRCTDFLIPALSVQPLVENSIKHGVCKKEDGGTVWISTYETEDAYCVVVRDDGVGFDMNAPMDPSRSHVGMQNVRSRLAVMVGGTLTIESEPGKGTTSTITIKK